MADRRDPAALCAEALKLAELGDLETARERAADALEISAVRDDPAGTAAANLVRARVELVAEDFRKARVYLERVLGRPASVDPVQLALACAERELADGEAATALGRLEGVASPAAVPLRARALTALGRAPEALELLQGTDWEAARGEALAALGRQKEAAEAFARAADRIQRAAAALTAPEAAFYLERPDRRAVVERAAGFANLGQEDLARLRRVLGVVRLMSTEPDPPRLLATILDVMIEVSGAARGMIIARRKGSRAVEVARHRSRRPLSSEELSFSRTILEEVLRTRRPVLSDDAKASVRFRPVDSVHQKELRSVLCLPLETSKGSLGAVYLDDREAAGAFAPSSLDLVRLLADQAALALERTGQIVERDEKITALESRVMELEERRAYGFLVGKSPAMRQVYALIDKLAAVDYPVVVEGETGTGKELLAQEIHRRSRRSSGPFVPVNCGALAETLLESELFGHVKGSFTGADRDKEGLFAQAGGGTLMLDEIEEMGEGMQKKLLRVLEDGRVRPVGASREKDVDVRLVAASNRSLKVLVAEGKFRSDLFYRLKAFSVTMPPLRERAEDIPMLIEHFLEQIAAEMKAPRKAIEAEAAKILMKAPWPGNVRELKNELRRLVVVGGERIAAADIPAHLRDNERISTGLFVPGKFQEKMAAYEKQLVMAAMEQNEGKIRAAARALGIDRNTLRAKLKRFGIAAADESD